MTTTLLHNGTIVDGSGQPGYRGHLLVEGDRIAALIADGGPLPEAETRIDVSDMVVAPGFIDMHSHADWLLPNHDHAPLLRCLVEQGVTTLVAGNCGISPAPLHPDRISRLESLASVAIDRPFAYTWRTMAGLLEQFERAEPVVNVAQLVGHASVRYAATQQRRGPLTPEQMRACLRATQQSLDEGACGLSFGLGYDPGMYTPLEEIAQLCSLAAANDKPATVHLKALSWISPCYPATHLGAHNVRALREVLDIAARTRVRLQLSHFIFVGRRSWRTAPRCIDLLDRARRAGVDVMIDAFPYTCGNTTVNAVLPYWFLALGKERYRDRWVRARLRLELELGARLVGFQFGDFRLMFAAIDGWQQYEGSSLPEIARQRGCSVFDTLLDLSELSNGAALVLMQSYSGLPGREEVLDTVLSHPACLFETDAVIRSSGHPNPAATGSFPRILGRQVRRQGLFSLPSAVRRMSAASAQRFGLVDRGRLAEGLAADIVVFDPERIDDRPGGVARPAGKPCGIGQVFINGARVLADGHFVDGVRAGRVLRN